MISKKSKIWVGGNRVGKSAWVYAYMQYIASRHLFNMDEPFKFKYEVELVNIDE